MWLQTESRLMSTTANGIYGLVCRCTEKQRFVSIIGSCGLIFFFFKLFVMTLSETEILLKNAGRK